MGCGVFEIDLIGADAEAANYYEILRVGEYTRVELRLASNAENLYVSTRMSASVDREYDTVCVLDLFY